MVQLCPKIIELLSVDVVVVTSLLLPRRFPDFPNGGRCCYEFSVSYVSSWLSKRGSLLSQGCWLNLSLTSCVGKVVERMINTRLMWHLETNNLIAKEQAGFRQNRSTEDQAAYFAQKVEDGFQGKQETSAVWIDMEKAFDKVWKDGLRLELRKNGISGCMYRWLSQYLENRKARVQLNGCYSRKKTLREGVPQGGILSPTLFLIYEGHRGKTGHVTSGNF